MNKILVPTDFTTVSEFAIKYACEIAEVTGYSVHILHIVRSEKEVDDANKKLALQASTLGEKFKIKIQGMCKVGNIFDDIPMVAEEEKAQLVVMGTHGLRGMQFIVGSNALRIISESTVPIIIIQDNNTRSAKLKKILAPLDLHKETKQKLKIAADVAERFKAEVHLISPQETDEYLHNRLTRNLAYAEGYMEERKLAYKTSVTESGSSGFVKELIKYARYAEIDLICILNTAEEQLIHAFGMDSEQKIITNDALIPVMVLNPAITLVDDRSIFAQ